MMLTCLSENFDLDGTLLIPVVVADFAVPLCARIPFPPALCLFFPSVDSVSTLPVARPCDIAVPLSGIPCIGAVYKLLK